MISFRGHNFEPATAELVVLSRAGKVTWGIQVRARPRPGNEPKEPNLQVEGLPFPAEGLDALAGKSFSLDRGEAGAPGEPQALIYVWDWSAANHNVIAIAKHGPDTLMVTWSGTCDDPDFYDSRSTKGTFHIDCVCTVRRVQYEN